MDRFGYNRPQALPVTIQLRRNLYALVERKLLERLDRNEQMRCVRRGDNIRNGQTVLPLQHIIDGIFQGVANLRAKLHRLAITGWRSPIRRHASIVGFEMLHDRNGHSVAEQVHGES